MIIIKSLNKFEEKDIESMNNDQYKDNLFDLVNYI